MAPSQQPGKERESGRRDENGGSGGEGGGGRAETILIGSGVKGVPVQVASALAAGV